MKATYVDHMGTDLSVVNAARVSFGKSSKAVGHDDYWLSENEYISIPRLSKADRSLIQFLARGCTSGDWEKLKTSLATLEGVYDWECHEMEDILNHIRRMPPHWSPFAHTAITIHLKMPIFVARQIMKHTTGLVYNEVSRRYVDSEPEFFIPKDWRKRADNVKQGSSGETVPAEPEDVLIMDKLKDYYKALLDADIAPEQARMVLPQSMYTEVIATGNLYAWTTMFNQRTDSHAQKETQDLAKQIGEVIEPLFPVSWKALTE